MLKLLTFEERPINGWRWYWAFVDDETGVEREGRTNRQGEGWFGRTLDESVAGSEGWSQSAGTMQFFLPDDYAAAKRKLLRQYPGMIDATEASA